MFNKIFVIINLKIIAEASYFCSTFETIETNETEIIQTLPFNDYCKRCGWFYAEFENGTSWIVGYCVPLMKRFIHFKNPRKLQTLKNDNIFGYPTCDSVNDTKAHIIDKYTIPPNSYLIFCTCSKDKCNTLKNVKEIINRRLKNRKNNGVFRKSSVLIVSVCIFLFIGF